MKHTYALLTAAFFVSTANANPGALSSLFDGKKLVTQERTEPWMVNALQKSEEVKVRAEAAKALGELGTEYAIQYLLEALYWDEDIVRRQAVLSLEKIGVKGPGTARKLEAALKIKNAELRGTIQGAMESIVKRKKTALEEALKRFLSEVKENGNLDNSMSSIQRLVTDEDIPEETAIDALRLMGQASAANVDAGIKTPDNICKAYSERVWRAAFSKEKIIDILKKIAKEARPPAKPDLQEGWGKDREWIRRRSYDPAIHAMNSLYVIARNNGADYWGVTGFLDEMMKDSHSEISSHAADLRKSIKRGLVRD